MDADQYSRGESVYMPNDNIVCIHIFITTSIINIVSVED